MAMPGVNKAGLTRRSRSGSSLHAKTFSVDSRARVRWLVQFVSVRPRLNTELGFAIDSPTLAQGMSDPVVRTGGENLRLGARRRQRLLEPRLLIGGQ